MATAITLRNLRKSHHGKLQVRSLAPFVTIHEVERSKLRDNGRSLVWAWRNQRTVDKTFVLIWHLTGEWKARRGAVVLSPSKVQRVIGKEVISLAHLFNRHDITSLHSFGNLSAQTERIVVNAIVKRVRVISQVKRTRQVEPMFGSKVLHHYFPTVVPVYDDLLISKTALKSRAFEVFAANHEGKYAGEGKRLREYRLYLLFCAKQILDTEAKTLRDLRIRMARLFRDLFPSVLCSSRRNNLLWRLDAKLAEYCLYGAER